jgi:cellulose biosynthesis protein BcsQ
MPDKAKCITFYSYKGGSGRSTTLINTVLHLKNELSATASNPLLIVDADLESAGLTYFFNCDVKFTRQFPSTIHTGKILNEGEDLLKGLSAGIIFGSEVESEYDIPDSILAAYDSLIKEEKGAQRPSVVFEGAKLAEFDIDLLKRIIECHRKIREKNTTPDAGSFEDYVETNYRIRGLYEKAYRIYQDCQNKTISPSERLLQLKTAILDFLPSRKLVDVSPYFGADKGVIFFLGADVGSDESIARNGAATAITRLLRLSASGGFRAVLFDSGAGTQSTPHVLHTVSDVIVYCLRPTQQFLKGTRMQIRNYRGELKNIKEKRGRSTDSKPLILLPTAVPQSDEGTYKFHNDSFEAIKQLADSHPEIIDDTFSDEAFCLHEVSLFKWREHILGAPFFAGSESAADLRTLMTTYAEEKNMPEDARSAVKVYRKLAEQIATNL